MKAIEFKDSKVVLIDQTLLPLELKYIECDNVECIAEAIENLRIRGAPAIGVAAAFGLALTALQNSRESREKILSELEKSCERLKKTRPTAVNLFWALDRVIEKARNSNNVAEAAVKEALRIYHEDVDASKKIGEHGAELIKNGDVILTHCNAGALATAGFGTALGVIRVAQQKGKKIKVFADETRPLLQGARLTAFELIYEGIPVTVITDSTAAFVMKNCGVGKVIVGADRIAANGDTANKIGTYGVAVLAKEHKILFYVAAPLSTIDLSISSGKEISIEFRNKREIEFFSEKRIVAEGAEVLNPAFDITPHEYIAGIITEKGVLRPPFEKSIKRAFES
ncbi:MAG: S-methyl-5-thioribose-1-phosphate isomerase [Candidatus Hydrothermarchaeota archaeon]|nr:S-methyl-5-thioribose-1-phosphate isomerase [Candidatus Hydrothermarchaeota archaeon]